MKENNQYLVLSEKIHLLEEAVNRCTLRGNFEMAHIWREKYISLCVLRNGIANGF